MAEKKSSSKRHSSDDAPDYSSLRGADIFGRDVANDYVGRFPFLDNKRWSEYKVHQKMFFDPYTSALPATVLFAAMFTRFNIYQTYFAGPYFSVAFSLTYVGVPVFGLVFFVHGAKSVIVNPSHQLRLLARRWRNTWWGQGLDGLMLWIVTLQVRRWPAFNYLAIQ